MSQGMNKRQKEKKTHFCQSLRELGTVLPGSLPRVQGKGVLPKEAPGSMRGKIAKTFTQWEEFNQGTFRCGYCLYRKKRRWST